MRQYTGNTDAPAKGLRPGMRVFIEEIIKESGGALWNNGDFGVRNMRSKNTMSVHATGRAVDLSYRRLGNKGKPNGRREAIRICKLLAQNAELFGLELIIDYMPKPHGRTWKCGRNSWTRYSKHTVTGAPGGDWLHVELSPEMADAPDKVRKAFQQIRAQATPQ
jgi:hypothetical protein